MKRETFLAELSQYESRFQNMNSEMELTVRDPDLDLEGYVVVWSTSCSEGGPLGRCGKGGTRITPATSLEEIKMLARIMTLKNAAAGLPLGGAKSGLKADPNHPGFEKQYKRFVSLVKPVLRENGGIFGGFGFDIGAKPVHALWACEALGSTASFTGKPVELGGTDYDREGIAGLGVAVAAKTAAEFGGRSVADLTYAVQGLGAMGAAVVRYFSGFGARLKYISDLRLGFTFRLPDNVPPELIPAIARQDHETAAGILEEAGCEKLPAEQILFQHADIVFPCAVQDVITMANFSEVKAPYLVEAANNPCSEEARRALHDRGVCVIPDFIANPGGIIAAFIEMSSPVTAEENAGTRRKVEEAKEYTRAKIGENVNKLLEIVRDMKVTPSEAGRFMAYSNIFKR